MNRKEIPSLLFRFSLIAVAATLPLSIYANSIAIILLTFSWILEGNIFAKLRDITHRPLIIFFLFFYALFILGMLYTENIPVGKFNLEKKISLFVLPLILGTSQFFNESIKQTVLKFFVASCFIASLICLGNGFYKYFFYQDSSYFFYMNLTSILDSHAIYFSMYVCFSIFILLSFLKNNFLVLKRHQKFFLFLIIFYFFCFIILLSARMVLVFLFFSLAIGGTYFSYKKRGLIAWFIILTLSSTAVVVIANRSVFLRERVTKLFESDFSASPDKGNANGLTIRLVKWQCSFEGIKDHLLLGTGTGDSQDYLNKCYERKNFWGQYPAYHFNSHNQYLETALTLGLAGLTFLLSCMIMPLVFAIRKKQILFISFLLLFAFNSLTESLLERQQGIVFFTFFISLFSFNRSS